MSRSSSATVPDFEGLIKTANENEARFEGSRRVENLLKASQDLRRDNWFNNPGTINRISESELEIVDFSTVAFYQDFAVKENSNYNFSFFSKLGTATGVRYAVYDVSNTSFITNSTLYNATPDYQRFAFSFTAPSGCTLARVYPIRLSSTAGTVFLKDLQVEETTGQTNQNPSEFTLPQWQGNELYFAGDAAQRVQINNTNDYSNTDFSLEAKFNLFSLNTINNNIFSQSNGTGTGRGWLYVDKDTKQIGTFIGGTGILYGSTLNLNQEYKIKLIHNATADTIEILLDDVSLGTQPITMESANGGFNIGIAKSYTVGTGFIGTIKDVIFTTGTEVFNLPINESEGEIAYDSSGNGNNGSLINFTFFPKYYDYENGNTVNGSGIVTENNGPKISDSVLKGILVENQRTNNLLYSEDYTQTNWVKTNCSITGDDATAPNGTQTADRLTTTTANNPNIYQNIASFTPDTPYTFSAWVKAGNISEAVLQLFRNTGGGEVINTEVGIISGPGSITGVGENKATITGLSQTEWTRAYIVGTPATGGQLAGYIKNRLIGATIGDYNYFWGAQLEEGNHASSYIKTVDTTATRSADNLYYEVPEIPLSFGVKITFEADEVIANSGRLWGTEDARGSSYEVGIWGSTVYSYTHSIGGGIFRINGAEILQHTETTMEFSVKQEGSNIRARIIKDGVEKLNTTVAGTLDHSNQDKLWIGSWNGNHYSGTIRNFFFQKV